MDIINCKSINLTKNHPKRETKNNVLCFFIVNNINDKEFIKNIARQFIEPDTYYHFYGKHENLWHFSFDDVFICEIDPDGKSEKVPLTCGCSSLKDLAEEICLAINYSFMYNDILLFYDDEKIYKTLVEMVNSMDVDQIGDEVDDELEQ